MALLTPGNGAYQRARPIKHAEIPTWQTSSDAVALSSGTVAATTISLGSLFHAANMKSRVDVESCIVSWAAGAGAGSGVKLKLSRITAEGAGGTVNNPVALDSRDNDPDAGTSTSTDFVSARYGSAAPSGRVTLATVMIGHTVPGQVDLVEVMRSILGQLPVMNMGVAEGYEASIVTGAVGPATAAEFAIAWRFLLRRP